MSRAALAILSTENLLHNLDVIKSHALNSHVIAMIKANGYGHGLRSTALRLETQVGAGTLLFKIIDPDKLHIRADVPESLAGAIQLGAIGQLRFANPGRVCQAKVVASTQSVDPIKRTVSYRMQPGDAFPNLLEGGFVDVQLPLHAATARDAEATRRFVTVPRDAVVEIEGVPVAFQATDNASQFKLRTLIVARHGDSTSYIEKGLQKGDRIVNRGALLLKGEWLRSRLE